MTAAIVVVCVVVAMAHWPVLSAQAFSFDDPQYMIENPLVQKPSWTTAGRFLGEVLKPSTVAGYYQPLTMISLMLDYGLGGRPDDLRQFHRTSLALHVANTGLIVTLLYLLFGHVWAAAAVGLLFGVHPMTVEPIPWVAERKTLLAAFFALGCLVTYVRYARQPNWPLYTVCGVLYVLALLSKPTSTPLPVLLLLLDYWPLRRLSRRTAVEKIPLLIVAGIFAVITIVSQGRAAGLTAPTQYDPVRILLTLCHNIVFYLHTIVWPVNLSWHYPFPEPLDFSQPAVLAGVIGTLVLIPVLLISWRWTRAALVGWLFFFVAIFPTIGVIGFTYVIAAHKFAYLPVVGLLPPLTVLFTFVWNAPAGGRRRHIGRVATIGVVILLAGLGTRTTRRDLSYWQETERLHRHMLRVTPTAHAVRYNLATFLDSQGRIDEAMQELERVLRQWPDHWKAHSSLGRAFKHTGQPVDAIAHLTEAVRLNPDYFPARYNLGIVLADQGRTAEAITHYKEARRLRPDDFRVHVNLGNALVAQSRFEDAIACYDEALRLKPRYARGHFNRGLALAKLGRGDDAIAEFRRALEIDPNFTSARQQLDAMLERRDKRPNR